MSEIFSIVKVGILFKVCVWKLGRIYKLKSYFLAWIVFCYEVCKICLEMPELIFFEPVYFQESSRT